MACLSPAARRMQGYIVEALFQLMAQKPFDEITAGEIAARAGVDRSTYYRYFKSKQAVLRFFLENALPDPPAFPAQSGRQEAFEEFFACCQRRRRELLLLYSAGLSGLLVERFSRPALLCPEGPASWQYAAACRLGGVAGCLLFWLSRQMQDDPAEMARMLCASLPPGPPAVLPPLFAALAGA